MKLNELEYAKLFRREGKKYRLINTPDKDNGHCLAVVVDSNGLTDYFYWDMEVEPVEEEKIDDMQP